MDATQNADLRKAAEASLARKRNFLRYLGTWMIVSIICVVIWFLSGRGSFWPVWVIFGMGIAALWMGWAAYGPRTGPPSETKVQEEMRRLED